MTYLEVPVTIEKPAMMHCRFVGPSDTKPDPEDGYIIDDEPIEIEGVPGKLWIEYKIVET